MSPELRVFISSTFQDLQEEREYLMKHVFPEIRHRCRQRGITFTEIDLRWGLTHEEGTLGRIIRTCFEEIDKCRPFFIGLLGARYGWVPQYLEIQKDPELLRRYPWIEDQVLDGGSLLDLEFSHGVLNDPVGMEGAFFYEKASAEATVSDADRDRWIELRRRVRASSRPMRRYDSLEDLGRHVRQDMFEAIETRWPEDETRMTRVAVERRGHEAFAAARRHAYIANPAMISQLTAHANSSGPPLMVVAESGLGKSALLAYWSNHFAIRHPDVFIITHFIGASPAGSTDTDVLRRVLDEIKERKGWTDPVPTQADAIEEAVPLWLARLGEPLIFVLDAVNQLDVRGHGLAWLPVYLPNNVRVICSSTPGPPVDMARARNWSVLPLAPLTEPEREALAVRFLGDYHKGLSEAQCHRLASHANCASPLFLRTTLEELRLFGVFEELDAHIDHYLASSDLPDLFQRVLERMERDFGAGLMREVMTLIWASRDGLAEDEMMVITGVPRVVSSRLVIALDYHLLQHEGRRSFFHTFLRRAVENRYLHTPELRVAVHERLGTFFSRQPADARRAEEEPWQWQHAGNLARLCASITDPALVVWFDDERRQSDVMRYWRELEPAWDARSEYRRALAGWKERHPNDAAWARLLSVVARLVLARGDYRYAAELLQEALSVYEAASIGETNDAAGVLDNLVDVHYALSEFDRAETYARRALTMYQALLPARVVQTIQTASNLGSLLHARGEFTEARRMFERCLEDNDGVDHALRLQRAIDLNNLATVCTAEGDVNRAAELLRDGIAILRAEDNFNVPRLAAFLLNLGLIEKLRGNQHAAEHRYREALVAIEGAVGAEHPLAAEVLQSLGSLALIRGKYGDAETHFADAERICCRVFGVDHPKTLLTKVHRASVYRESGRLQEALQLYAEVLPALELRLGHDDRAVADVRHNMRICQEQLSTVARDGPITRH